jgi:hypothetical protein
LIFVSSSGARGGGARGDDDRGHKIINYYFIKQLFASPVLCVYL